MIYRPECGQCFLPDVDRGRSGDGVQRHSDPSSFPTAIRGLRSSLPPAAESHRWQKHFVASGRLKEGGEPAFTVAIIEWGEADSRMGPCTYTCGSRRTCPPKARS